MTDSVITAICASLPPTLVAFAALLRVIKVHKELNSRLTEWKDETAKATIASNAAAKAEGVKEAEDKARGQ
jgi:hypothetical protein